MFKKSVKNSQTIDVKFKNKSIAKRLIKDVILSDVRPYIYGGILLLTSSILTIISISLIKTILDKGFVSNDFYYVLRIVCYFFVVALGAGLTMYFGRMKFIKSILDTLNDMKKQFVEKTFSLDMSLVDNKNTSYFHTRFISDFSSLQDVVNSFLRTIFVDCITCFALLGLMFYYSWSMSLIAIFTFPLLWYFVKYADGNYQIISVELKKIREFLSAKAMESFKGFKIVKSYNMENVEKQNISEILDDINNTFYKRMKVDILFWPGLNTLVEFIKAIIILAAFYFVSRKTMTFGEFFAFWTAAISAFYRFANIAYFVVSSQDPLASAKRIYEVLDLEAFVLDKKDAKEFKGLKKSIVLKDVSFAYGDLKAEVIAESGVDEKNSEIVAEITAVKTKQNPALNKINLEFPVGKTIALVGTSGGGKSTITNMILRLYDPQGGAVLFDGIDVKDYSQTSIRRKISYVSQDILLLDASVKNNIAIGVGKDYKKTPLKKIEEAAKKAHADEFIKGFEKGYDTMVGESGKRLSGGQKQRISIARAIIKDAPIIILDEATSALDNESERKVQAALKNMSKGKTTIVIAHRLSTIKHADLIYVIDKGRVVESGTHADLLEKDGFYANLYTI